MLRKNGIPICEALFLALIATFALPTGTIFGFPLKLVLLGLSALTMLPFLLDGKILRDRTLWAFAGIALLIVAWMGLAVRNGYLESACYCILQFFGLVFVVLIGYLGYKSGALSVDRVTKALRLAAVAVVALDVLYEILMLTGFGLLFYPDLYNTGAVSEMVRFVFGKGIVTCKIPFAGFHLFRITLPNDVLVLSVLPFELLREQSWRRRAVVLLIAGLFAVMTYSRVVMLQYAIVIGILAVVQLRRLDAKTLKRFLLIGAIAMAALAPLGWRVVRPAIYDRMMSQDAHKSDNTRVKQYHKLMDGIKDSPWVGYGLGSFVREPGRKGDDAYSYELQYLSFVYQFGAVGFVLIIGGIVFLCFRLCLNSSAGGAIRAVVWFNLAVWALKPLFNPQFLSSNSASVIIATLFLGMAGKAAHD